MQKTKLRGVACNRRSRRRWWILTAILVADGLILAGEVYLIWRWWIG
jgi:CHASE2 domain-containing sensor protein